MIEASIPSRPFATLRKFVASRKAEERCELCGANLAAEHQHLLELSARRLVCACDACAVLFEGSQSDKFTRVPRRIVKLRDFRISDAQWENLSIPINLAFIYQNTSAQRIVAMYPSPAGATESLLTFESWQDLAAQNPKLCAMLPDVEAILINRIGESREYFCVPIDECFKLVGVIRKHWRGLSGGTDVWRELKIFFDQLNNRATNRGGHD